MSVDPVPFDKMTTRPSSLKVDCVEVAARYHICRTGRYFFHSPMVGPSGTANSDDGEVWQRLPFWW